MKLHIFFALGLLLSGCQPAEQKPVGPATPQQLAVPAKGAYTGAYMDFGETEDGVTLEKIEAFEKMVGKQQAIVASSSYWGENTFPSANIALIARHGAVPLIFWSPWDKPYDENKGPDRFSLEAILSGKWDEYVDRWADGAKAFGRPMMVSFGNEMNGSWFPWSGVFYGGGEPGSAPGSYRGPETFKKTWRYLVDRLRARGATNVLWVFHVMDYSYPGEKWNDFAQYYPGPEYVDWLGLSVYGKQFNDEDWSPFEPLYTWPLEQLGKLDPAKPLMLTEWGIGEFPEAGSKADFIRDAFAVMPKNPRLKAAIFWHERWQNQEGYYSNLRVNSSHESLKAYREGVASPFWLARPIFRP